MNQQKGAQAPTGSACPQKAEDTHLQAQAGTPGRSTQITLDRLPDLLPRPPQATDHTGKRRGRMTAIAWCRSGHPGKATLWLCRCDCGLYEYRRPGTWDNKPFLDDRCMACLQGQGPNARQTAPARLQRWMDELRGLGLSEEEIERIRVPGAGVETRGRTLEDIRAQLAAKR